MHTVDNEINNYLNDVCSFIRNKKAHKEIKTELNSHIEDLIDEYTSSGMSKEESIKHALLEMGSPKIVGTDINKAHRTNSDWILLIFTASLVVVGLYTTFFIENSSTRFLSTWDLSKNSIIMLIISILISVLFIKVDFRRIKKYSKFLYMFSTFLMLITYFIGPVVNGNKRFLSLGSFSVNVWDLASLLFIISLAGIFDNYNWNNNLCLLKGIILFIFPCLLFLLLPSASLVLYIISAISIMLLSGFKIKYIIILCSGLGTIFFTYLFSSEYRLYRILSFLYPERDPSGNGYVYNQIFNLKNSAGITGNQNTAVLSNLPAAHTDFVLTSIIYSFGWIAAIALSAVIIAFIIRIIFIGHNTKNSYGKLLIYGICSLFLSQYIFSILSSLLLFPALGFTMPFISYGGASIIINVLAVSLINNIYKNRNNLHNSTI